SIPSGLLRVHGGGRGRHGAHATRRAHLPTHGEALRRPGAARRRNRGAAWRMARRGRAMNRGLRWTKGTFPILLSVGSYKPQPFPVAGIVSGAFGIFRGDKKGP